MLSETQVPSVIPFRHPYRRDKGICLLVNVPQAHISVPGFCFQDSPVVGGGLRGYWFQLLWSGFQTAGKQNQEGAGPKGTVPSWKFQIAVYLKA